MGLLDWIKKSQEKLNDLQKRIDTFSVGDHFKQRKPKHKTDTPKQIISDHVDAIDKPTAATAKSDRSIESIGRQIMAQRDSFIRNGFSEYEFIANRDCCSVCGALNGKHFPVRRLKIGVNAPPMHEGCRCSIAAYTDREEYEEWLNSFSK